MKEIELEALAQESFAVFRGVVGFEDACSIFAVVANIQKQRLLIAPLLDCVNVPDFALACISYGLSYACDLLAFPMALIRCILKQSIPVFETASVSVALGLVARIMRSFKYQR